MISFFRAPYEERLDLAASKASWAAANITYYTTLMDFYASTLKTIDHDVDWWGYAKVSQKLQDAADGLSLWQIKLKECEAKLEDLVASRGESA